LVPGEKALIKANHEPLLEEEWLSTLAETGVE
jgi:hypothetical protein